GAVSINGVGAASRLFFRKDVRNITLSEAALLAGMIQAPSAYNPYRNPKQAKSRRDTVLLAMKNIDAIDEAEYAKGMRVPIRVYPYKVRVRLAPYFGDLVKQQLLSEYDEDDIYKKNLQVITTIDLDMQEAAEEALAWGLSRIDRIRGNKTRKRLQGCLIAIDPKTGHIRAFVGGRSYSRSQFDRISKASRQPGSAFKPIVYATALEMNFEGFRYFSPATLISDEPETFNFHNVVWQPKNYDGEYHGVVPMRTALAKSMNVATAKLAQNVGLQKVADVAKRFGFPNVMAYPSLALGTFEVNPWQLIEAFSVFANGGRKTALQSIEKVIDPSGKLKGIGEVESEEVIHSETAYLITDMLKTTMNSGTAASSRRLGFARPAAGKTGTTNDFRDAWFVGYTPNLMCLVWTGYDDNTPFWMNGAQAALPIWVRFMRKATATLPAVDFQPPGGIVPRLIDPTTGKLASEYCFEKVTELFIQGSEPTQQCTEYDHYSPFFIGFSTDDAHMDQMLPEPEAGEDENWFPWPFSDREREVEEPEVEEPSPEEEMSFPEEDPAPQDDYIYFAAPEPENSEPEQQLEPEEPNPELWEPQSQTQSTEEEPPE
ncbi:MAG TPA: penicillin-binding transpeptidase domain-containing protein, partial [Acidobacteriota bacterium]